MRINITDGGRNLLDHLTDGAIARRVEYVQAEDGTWSELLFEGAIGAERVRAGMSFGEVLECIAIVVDPDGQTVEV